MHYYVYILTNATNVAIYVGVTKDIVRRMYEHRHKLDPNGFTARYNIHKLVYFECTNDVKSAIEREKQIKSWNRARKTDWLKQKIHNGWTYMNQFCNKKTDCHASLIAGSQ